MIFESVCDKANSYKCMWMPLQGIKYRDFVSVVCTSNWNGRQASAKLNKGKNCFELALVPVSKWE